MLHQNLLHDHRVSRPMPVRKLHESDLTVERVREFLAKDNTLGGHIGIAGGYIESSSVLTVLAVVNSVEILFFQLGANKRKKKVAQDENATAPTETGLQILEREIFCNPECTTYAFNMGTLALALYFDHGIKIAHGVDIQDVCDKEDRSPLASIMFAMGDKGAVYVENVEATFKSNVWDSQTGARTLKNIVFQAWAAQYLRGLADMEEPFRSATKVNSHDKDSVVCPVILKLTVFDILIAVLRRSSTILRR